MLCRSIECVENLIRTLVGTSNNYKLCLEKEARLAQDLALAQAQLFPLRKENANLARDNHLLHEENIKSNEEIQAFKTEQLNEKKHLQDKVNELIFVCKSKDSYIAKVDAELERIKSVSELNWFEWCVNPLQEMGEYARRKDMRPLVKITRPISTPEISRHISHVNTSVEEISVIELLKRKLEDSNHHIEELIKENMRLSGEIKVKDHELNRDARLIDTHRSLTGDSRGGAGDGFGDAGSSSRLHQLMASETHNRTLIDQFNGQIDFLNEQVALREAQLVEMGNKLKATEDFQAILAQKYV